MASCAFSVVEALARERLGTRLSLAALAPEASSQLLRACLAEPRYPPCPPARRPDPPT